MSNKSLNVLKSPKYTWKWLLLQCKINLIPDMADLLWNTGMLRVGFLIHLKRAVRT